MLERAENGFVISRSGVRSPASAPQNQELTRAGTGGDPLEGSTRGARGPRFIHRTGIRYVDRLRVEVVDRRPKSSPRARVYLGRRHPYASSSGQQWRARLVAMIELGRRLRPDEHVHHRNGNTLDDRPENLEVVLAEYHGSYHATLLVLTGGYLRELEHPSEHRRAFRAGPVISRRPVSSW